MKRKYVLTRKGKNPVKGKQVIIAVGISPEDLARWRAKAQEEERSLSQWIRLRVEASLAEPKTAEARP